MEANLSYLINLSDDERIKGIQLLLRIFKNVLKEPNNVKYHNLNLHQITTRLKSPIFVNLLINAGFHETENGDRLLFDVQRFNELKMINNALLHLRSQNSSSEKQPSNNQQFQLTINDLVNAGFTEKEAVLAVSLSNYDEDDSKNASNNNETKSHNNTSGRSPLDVLQSMGFDLTGSAVALAFANNDINIAAQILLDDAEKSVEDSTICNDTQYQSMCNGNIQSCYDLLFLKQFINEYNESKLSDECNESKSITNILNAFNHLLDHHRNDEEFEYIYKLFGGDCEATKCRNIQRYYDRERKTFFIQDILDRIHCHVQHSYDIGSRLSLDEQKQISDNHSSNNNDNNNQSEKPSTITTNSSLFQLKHILKSKLKKYQQIIPAPESINGSKFCSDLNLVNTNNAVKSNQIDDNKSDSTAKYSYSFPFIYSPEILKKKTLTDYGAYFDKLTYDDLLVRPNYDNLKEEVTQNAICVISINDWNYQMEKAMSYLTTINAKQAVAATKNYCPAAIYRLDHPIHYGFKDGSPITVNHLVALIIYCRYTLFQNRFTETYRPLYAKEPFNSIKSRHSNFYHFAVHIHESVQVFGKEYHEGSIERVYHGINQEMLFEDMHPRIHGPLSTTYQWIVAVQFSENKGCIAEFVPSVALKYFECEWLSDYSYEAELLFIGGFVTTNLMNITMTKSGFDFSPYMTALRLIENMTSSGFFMKDPADILKMNKFQTRDIVKLKLPNINATDKKLCFAMISHELNRNGYKIDKYRKYTKLLPKYVESLLHHICQNKTAILVEWKTFTKTILSECEENGGGYIGYKCFSSLVCNKNYQGIDLDLFNALFPKLNNIKIHGLSHIDSGFLDEILEFIKDNTTSKISYIQLEIAGEYKSSNVVHQCNEYKSRFKNVGFNMFHTKHPGFGTYLLCIKRLAEDRLYQILNALGYDLTQL